MTNPHFFKLHNRRHPGKAKMLCMLTKMLHKYTTLPVKFQGVPMTSMTGSSTCRDQREVFLDGKEKANVF